MGKPSQTFITDSVLKESLKILRRKLSGYPLLGVAISLIVGIVVGVRCEDVVLWVIVGGVGVAFCLLYKGLWRYWLIMVLFVVVGYWLGTVAVPRDFGGGYDRMVTVVGIAGGEVTHSEKWGRVEIDVLDYCDSSGVWHADGRDNASVRLLANFSRQRDSLFSCKGGDTVVLRGRVRRVEGAYGRYLRLRRGVVGQIYGYSFARLGGGPTVERGVVEKYRQQAHRRIMALRPRGDSSQIVETAASGLLSAMVVGDRSGLDDTTTQNYRTTGLGHILAISGLHIGIVVVLLNFLFGVLKLWDRRGRVVFSVVVIVALWCYAVFSGMAVSVQRAAIMFTLYQLALLSNRSGTSINTLCGSAVLIILLDPLVLWDVGFQLSYGAMLGISVFYIPLVRLIDVRSFSGRWGWLQRSGWSVFSLSLSAQLCVAPLVVYYFGHFPWVSLLLSFLVFVTVPLIVISGLVYLLTGFVWIGLLGVWVCDFQNRIVDLVGGVGWVCIEGLSLGLWGLVVWYVVLGLVGFWFAGYSAVLSGRRMFRFSGVGRV